jgi:hypothetical protein
LTRTRYLLLSVVFLMIFGYGTAAKADCHYTLLDVATVSGTDPDGTGWSYTNYYYGWLCTDGYLPDERPYDPAGGGGTYNPPPPPPPPPPAPTGCSFSECTQECDAHYLTHSGVEMVGEHIIEHYIDFECGIYCQESARMDWEACKGNCITDCNLP